MSTHPLQKWIPEEKEDRPLWLFLLFSLVFAALFYEWLAGLAALILLAGLLIRAGKNGWKASVSLSWPVIGAGLLALAYAASALWAVDRGMAPFGFLKELPLFLFALWVALLTLERRASLFNVLPVVGVGMTVLSFAGKFLPGVGGIFTVSGRLAGFFQYPNTFGLFLLLGVVALGRQHLTPIRLAGMAVLVFGIVQSGSRAVLALSAVTWVPLCALYPEKRGKRFLAVLLGGGALAAVLAVLIFGQSDAIKRLLTNPLESSTFLGRQLYWKDALPVILRHPFGLGYLGYRYLQGSFQTGVYSVRFVHNELLQLLLDVGWLPALAVLVAVGRSFLSSRITVTQKMILGVLCAHALFDFDLQFTAMGFIGLLCLDFEPIRKKPLALGGTP